MKTTLKSILKYNYRESMAGHFNNMRSYALGEESALLMASWPKGRPKVPFPYFSEVMTGFEYAAAIGMIYEGMEPEGHESDPGYPCTL
jgi:non-lysosomal glucosylceramidase